MVVLVIMALISGGVAMGVLRSMERARRDTTLTRARTIQAATVGYLLDKPLDCPTLDDLLSANSLDKTTDPNDGWHRQFRIECEGSTVHVRSAGSDGEFGTDDDIGF